jgi:hypothetical protein
MKASVQVFKTDLGSHAGVGRELSGLCTLVEDHGDIVEFHPREGEMMNVICILLDKEVVYKLNLEQKPVAG